MVYNLNTSNLNYKSMPTRSNTKFRTKINQAIHWLLNEDYKFVSVYFEQPDQIAHKYGLDSPEFNVTLDELDQEFGYLIGELKKHHLYQSGDFNLLVVSGHVNHINL